MGGAFRNSELARIEESGWVTNPRLQELVEESRLPSPLDFLTEALTSEQWCTAERLVGELRARFARRRFAATVDHGILLVPDPARLDTRTAVPATVRAAQHPGLGEDFVDPLLPAGRDLTRKGSPWTPFLSVVGIAGFSAGSYREIVGAPGTDWAVEGFDTRTAMTRQLWGARLLQSPAGRIPDSDLGETWTFTLFPGEPLVDGRAVSGTVLKGRVRFRLGKTDRGNGSVRVAPAVPL